MRRELTLKYIKDRCTEEGECWTWNQSVNRRGYPQMSHGGKKGLRVWREAYRLSGRPLRKGQVITATCGNRQCCNPAHLTQVTKSALLKDVYGCGMRSTPAHYLRMFRNAKHFRKLDWPQVLEIRAKSANGAGNVELAKDYGLSRSAIERIVKGQTWRTFDVFSRYREAA